MKDKLIDFAFCLIGTLAWFGAMWLIMIVGSAIGNAIGWL